jgi:putative ABC transport system substrate-binding protein
MPKRSVVSRREILPLLGGAAAVWPALARAQQKDKIIPIIGILDNAPIWNAFRQRLREHGYIEGQSVRYEYREARSDPARLFQAATELAGLKVDIIATFGTPASIAAKQATTTIPILMVSIGDPVGAGLVASISRPGGNATGNTILGPEMAAKRLQLLREILPSLSRVAFLRNPGNASNALILEELKIAARAVNVDVDSVEVRSVEHFDAVFSEIARKQPDALMLTNDPLQQLNMGRITDFLARNRLPGMYQARENVIAGGLISYGANLPDLFRRVATYAHRILQGTKPGDLPIEQPTKFELVINMKTAKTLGLAISESFLLRADEVIE